MATASKNIKLQKSGKTKAPKIQNDTDFPTDWDVDQYKTEYESDEHWQLRRKFMEYHKNAYPEERLVCLAQVFVNVEFMGCRYPEQTMRLVADLSKELAKEFRDSRSGRLKRTFVAGSEAAEQRVKGRRNLSQQATEAPSTSRAQFQQREETEPPAKIKKDIHDVNDLFTNLPYGKFVLTLLGQGGCIQLSAQRSKIKYEERATGNTKMELILNGKVIGTGHGSKVKEAKAMAFSSALEHLQGKCYSIKLNPIQSTIQIDKKNKKVTCGVIKQLSDEVEGEKLNETNIGFKMMKMMGWSGGGLGSNKQGREEPVSYLTKNNRHGIGSDINFDHKYFQNMLKNYIESEDIRDLRFEKSFTKEERAILHGICGKLNLKSTARGSGENRYLTISKKVPDNKILFEVLLNKNSSYLDKYLVQVPESKAHLYPEHTQKLDLDMPKPQGRSDELAALPSNE